MTQLATVKTASAILRDEPLYEIVDGVKMELPPMGTPASLVTAAILTALANFVVPGKLGFVVSETLFVIKKGKKRGGRSRRPDVAYVSFERWPADREVPDEESWNVIPTLAVEVISRTDRHVDSLVKLREYFEAGVEQVWHVVPPERLVYIYESPTRATILDGSMEIDGDPVLPGFRVPVAQLFWNPIATH